MSAKSTEQRKVFKIKFIDAYFGQCEEDFTYALRYVKKYNPGLRVPSKATIYKWIADYKEENPHIDDYDHCDVEVMAPAIVSQQKQLERDFLQMSVVQLRDYFKDSILKTIVQQSRANDLMGKMVARLDALLSDRMETMTDEELMKYLLALGKAIKPFAAANETYLNMLEKLKIKHKEIQVIEKEEKNRLEITTRRINDQEETITGSDSDD